MQDDRTKRDEAIRRNYEALKVQLPELMKTHAGKFALMRDGKVVEFFDTARDAMLHGTRTFADGLFSVQEVSQAAVDLGWFSHAPHYATP